MRGDLAEAPVVLGEQVALRAERVEPGPDRGVAPDRAEGGVEGVDAGVELGEGGGKRPVLVLVSVPTADFECGDARAAGCCEEAAGSVGEDDKRAATVGRDAGGIGREGADSEVALGDAAGQGVVEEHVVGVEGCDLFEHRVVGAGCPVGRPGAEGCRTAGEQGCSDTHADRA